MNDTLHTDVLIIGGGINGTGIAADAASRNLSVILCEKADLASGTSSASTKLIHGGLRYLEQYHFKLVRESLREREILLHRAPHLVHPLEFILPYQRELRPAWMIRLGLFLYDHLTKNISLPKSKTVNLQNTFYQKILKSQFKKGFRYYDCQTDDARLVVANALAAKEKGARIFTRTACVAAKREEKNWLIELHHKNTQQTQFIKARAVINVSGPWVKEVSENIFRHPLACSVQFDQGSHLVFPKLYAGDHAYILQNPDQRIIFAIPYEQNFTLVGTTDIPFTGNPEHISTSDTEKEYLCASINQHFQKNISPTQCVWNYTGLRTLYVSKKAEKVAKISRESHVEVADLHGQIPLITVIGGKLTTYRKLAEEVIDALAPYFSNVGKSQTQNTLLPGGFSDISFSDFSLLLQEKHPWLPSTLYQRLARQYGTLAYKVIGTAKSIADLGMHFGGDLYEKEVRYLLENEWAETADDILWRRSKQGLFFNEGQARNLATFLNKLPRPLAAG
jgi:glycerol-3-phosphate dehydrogenase